MSHSNSAAVESLTVLVTSFQKEASIFGCLQQLIRVLDASSIPFRVILLDDASKDFTVDEAYKIRDQRLTIRRGTLNVGKGKLIRQNISEVRDSIVGIFDGDLDIHPKTLVEGYKLLTNNKNIGAAIGSKQHPNSTVEYPLSRKLLSRIFQFISHILFGLSVGDSQTGAKVFRTKELAAVCTDAVADGFMFDLEILVRMSNLGLGIVEIPIELDYKFDSTIGFGSTLKTGLDMFRVWRSMH